MVTKQVGQSAFPAQDATGSIQSYIANFVGLVRRLDPVEVIACVEAVWSIWNADRTVFVIGNGGSASTASHIAVDFAKETQVGGRRPLRVHALTDNVETMTALANDTSYENVFAGQLRMHARRGDLLLAISCSGTSPNVIGTIRLARELGLIVGALGGTTGGRLRELSDFYIHVPSNDYGQVETVHVLLDHLVTSLLRKTAALYQKPVIMLDRDGVLIRERPDYVKTVDDIEFLPGALNAVATLSKRGHRVFVVTNQSVVGRGLTSQVAVDAVNSVIAEEVQRLGGLIEGFLVCPHEPESGCDCRKPAPGLLYRARDQHGVDLATAILVGDSETDCQAARAAGCASILLTSERPSQANNIGTRLFSRNLVEATDLIIGLEPKALGDERQEGRQVNLIAP